MEKSKVLVVEDDAEIAELLEFNLQNRGYRVALAETGLAACQQIGVEHPDLILLDLMLPDFDGREICKMIRGHNDEKIAGIPIIMLTAMAAADDRVRGLELGADDYLTKPFSVEELLVRVKKLLASRWNRGNDAQGDVAAPRAEGARFKEFQEMVFHELANQLIVVQGFSDRLYKHGAILPQEKVRSYAEAIYRSSTHLGSLAEEMLLLRRVENSGAEAIRHDITLGELARELREVVSLQAQARGIEVTVDITEGFPVLRLNRPSLKIILSCLLENAVKYGRPGGKVLLASAVLTDGNRAIYVEDDGLGIPEGEEQSIFEKFQRGSNVSSATKGTGLGLYFAKTLTEALGGAICVHSAEGGGSRFRILFPAAEKSKAA